MRLWTLHTLSGMSQIVNRKSHLSHWSQSELSSPRTLLHVGLRPYKASRPRTLASKNSGRQYELRVHVDGLRLTLTLCLLRLPLSLHHACTKSIIPALFSLSLSLSPVCLCGVCVVCVVARRKVHSQPKPCLDLRAGRGGGEERIAARRRARSRFLVE